MFLTSGVLPLVCLTWLVVVGGRPSPQQRQKQPMANEMTEEGVVVPGLSQDSGHRSVREASASDAQAARAWGRILEFTNNHKSSRGRSKKGSSKGCFGMKMDRIGSMSKFGC